VGTQDSSHIPPRRKFVYHVRQNYRHATIVALPKRSAGCCHNYQCGSSRAAVWISCLIIMFSGSMDPCRDDPRVACTGAISPRLKRHVGCCHTTNVTPHEQPLFLLPKELCINTGHQRNLLGIPNPIFIFKTKEASLETAPAGGAVACKQDNQGPRPQGGQKLPSIRGIYAGS
jgi:hypothetical protein